MKRDFLEGLGLEKDVIDSIMKEHGTSLNATKQELAAMTTDRDGLKEQLTERDGQLEKLSKVDAKGLQAEIDRLKNENAETATKMQEKLDAQSFDFSLEKALSAANVRNPKAVKALLDTESIKLDGDKLLNLDSQLEALKTSDAYLFETEKAPDNSPTFVTGGNPNGGSAKVTKSLSEMSYQELSDLKTNNPAEYAELTK